MAKKQEQKALEAPQAIRPEKAKRPAPVDGLAAALNRIADLEEGFEEIKLRLDVLEA
jgi:hypothetical protein